jgi:hypothetical protein
MTRVPKKEKRSLRNPFRQFDFKHFSPIGSQNVDVQANLEKPETPSQSLIRRPLTKATTTAQPTAHTAAASAVSGSRNADPEVQLAAQRNALMTLQRPEPIIQSDPSNLLAGSCNILSTLLTKRSSSQRTAQIADPQTLSISGCVTASKSIYRLPHGKTTLWVELKVIASAPTVGTLQKTAGCIRSTDSKEILMTSFSGWKPGTPVPTRGSILSEGEGYFENRDIDSSHQVLDPSTWTQAVLNFCARIGHKLPLHWQDHKNHPGRYHACHIEKRLVLFFLCHYLTDGGKSGFPDEKKLKAIREGKKKLEAVLFIDRAPCRDCLEFIEKVKVMTGLVVRIKVVRILAEAERYKDGNMTRLRVVKGKQRVQTTHTPGRGERKTQEEKLASRKEWYRRKKFARTTIIVHNPRFMVLIPSIEISQKVASSETPRKRQKRAGIYPSPATTPRRRYVSPSPPASPTRTKSARNHELLSPASSTPTRATRNSGLLTPSESPFSFDALDNLRRRQEGRKIRDSVEQLNRGIELASLASEGSQDPSPSPMQRRVTRFNGLLLPSPTLPKFFNFDALDRLDRRRGKRGARSGKRTYVD